MGDRSATVLVGDGTYTGPGNVDIDFLGKSLDVESVNGAAKTIIDCQGSASNLHRGFYFHNGETTAARLDGFTIENGFTDDRNSLTEGQGGGIYISSASPTITNCVVRNNTVAGVEAYGGGLSVIGGSPTITACSFIGNTAGIYGYLGDTYYVGWGGGMAVVNSGTPIITACIFSNNTANNGNGGGILFDSTPTIIQSNVINCVFTDNRASYGGGICDLYTSLIVMNSTFSNNTSQFGGGTYGSPVLTNCVLYGDHELINSAEADLNWGTPTVTYSDIQGGYPGTGNIDADPLFVNPSAGNLHLQSGSPCLGAGTATGAPTTDLDGNLRSNPPSMGAYEVPVPQSITGFTLSPNQINAVGSTVFVAADVSVSGTFSKITVSPAPGTLNSASPTFTLTNNGTDWTGQIATAYLKLAKTNPVTFIATGTRPDGSKTTATATLRVGPLPTLSLTLTSDKPTVQSNETFTLSGFVRDQTTISAPSATVQITLPQGLNYVSSNGFTYNATANTLTWTGPLTALNGIRAISIMLQASSSAPKQTPLTIQASASCTGFQTATQNPSVVVEAGLVPIGVDVDATSGYGLLDGTAQVDTSKGTPPLYATISPVSSLSNIWLGMDYVTPANGATVNPASGVGYPLAVLGLIAPDFTPSYSATFQTINSSVTMGVSLNDNAAVMNIAAICIQTLDALANYGPQPTSKDLLDVFDLIQEVKAFHDVAQSFNPPPTNAFDELLAVGGAIRTLANLNQDASQQIAQIVFKLFGKTVASSDIARQFKVLNRAGAIFDLLRVLADELTLVIQTQGDEMVVTFTGSPIK